MTRISIPLGDFTLKLEPRAEAMGPHYFFRLEGELEFSEGESEKVTLTYRMGEGLLDTLVPDAVFRAYVEEYVGTGDQDRVYEDWVEANSAAEKKIEDLVCDSSIPIIDGGRQLNVQDYAARRNLQICPKRVSKPC